MGRLVLATNLAFTRRASCTSIHARSSLLVKLGNIIFPKLHHPLPLNKYVMQDGCVLVASVEWRHRTTQSHQSKPLLSIVSNDPYATVVYANPFVNGDVEGKVVVEGTVGRGGVGKLNCVREAPATVILGSSGQEMSKNRRTDQPMQQMLMQTVKRQQLNQACWHSRDMAEKKLE